MLFEPGLEPSRLRGGAESPWNSDGDLSPAYSTPESTHVVPSSEPLRPGEPSKTESPGDGALLGVETLAAPARDGLNGTARMLGCRGVGAPAVVLPGVLGSVGPRCPSSPCWSRSPASVVDVGTGGTGLFLSGDPGGARPVRRSLRSSRADGVSRAFLWRWRRSFHSMTAVAARAAERPTARPAMRPVWLTFGWVQAFGAEGVGYDGDWAAGKVVVVVLEGVATTGSGDGVSSTTAVVVSERERNGDVIGSGDVWKPGWLWIGQAPGSSQGSMEQQPSKLLVAQA